MSSFIIVLVLLLVVDALSFSSSLSRVVVKRTMIMSSSDSINSDSIDKCGPCPLAPKCKGDYKDKGCDGTGKIKGGIATIGFMSWWPIKVYRPCPSYLQAGYVYRREGQTMDQVLFSEPSTRQKEKFAELRRDEAAKALGATSTDAERSEKIAIELTEAERLLEEKFGKNSSSSRSSRSSSSSSSSGSSSSNSNSSSGGRSSSRSSSSSSNAWY